MPGPLPQSWNGLVKPKIALAHKSYVTKTSHNSCGAGSCGAQQQPQEHLHKNNTKETLKHAPYKISFTQWKRNLSRPHRIMSQTKTVNQLASTQSCLHHTNRAFNFKIKVELVDYFSQIRITRCLYSVLQPVCP